MKTMKKIILVLIVIGPIAFTQSCAPNLARTNARIEKGFEGGVSGMRNLTSKDDVKHQNQSLTQINLEVGGGYRNEKNMGFSVLGKAGIGSVPTLDFYLELPSTHPFYYGIGAEVSDGVGGYLIGSYYFTEVFFLTLTGRVYEWNKQLLLNPQLSIGYSAKRGWPITSIFAGYHYLNGRGIDMDTDIDGRGYTGYVNQLIYGGVSFEF